MAGYAEVRPAEFWVRHPHFMYGWLSLCLVLTPASCCVVQDFVQVTANASFEIPRNVLVYLWASLVGSSKTQPSTGQAIVKMDALLEQFI